MEKMLRIPLAMMVSVLSIFLVAGGANALTYLTSADCGSVLNTPNETYELSSDMICSTRHGLIIGASGITINGAGYRLDGSNTVMGSRHCRVNVGPEEVADRMWCNGHPCRQADVMGGDNDPATFDGCLDSGVLNADPTTCEDGFDNVTITNLEITGWCDGIFVSGDCTGTERRLTGLLIVQNRIHDNGNPECGSYTPCSAGDGGDWTNRYYNDAIFTAQIGIDGDDICPECANKFPNRRDVDGKCCALPSERNVISHNIIWNQNGCGCVSCTGGNGINLQGGLEIENIIWTGCNEIASNCITNCYMSGIQYSHATKHNRIKYNRCTNNGIGGITDPCGWCDDNYINDNVCNDNGGMGIGVNAVATMNRNECNNNIAIPGSDPRSLLGYPTLGDAIVCGDGVANCILAGNNCSGNAGCGATDCSDCCAGADIHTCFSGYYGDINKDCSINNFDLVHLYPPNWGRTDCCDSCP